MIVATTLKEVRLLLHDRARLLLLFLMPVLFITVFGSMFRFKASDGPRSTAIWHAPGDARGEAIARALGNTKGFSASPMAGPDEVRRAVATRKVEVGLVVPASGPVELVIDLAAPAQVRDPLQGALGGVVLAATSPVPIDRLPPLYEARSPPGMARPLADPTGFQSTVPGNAVLFGFFLSMSVAMSFAHERNSGTWKRVLSAPVARWMVLVGKLVPYYVIGLCQLAFVFGIGALFFGLKAAGSLSSLLLLTAVVVLTTVSLGMLVASFGGTERQVGTTVPVVLLVMGLLSGCMYPRSLMPAAMQRIGLAIPHAWALDGYYAVFVRQGTSIADIAPQLVGLGAFSIVFLAVGIGRFDFER